ncbi:hypothetical protein VTJ49DRAFT_3409 [Mycothermus thermophilus]|uniref:C2H2-type domain-containing protein n=1 Tax=Humicola insolens TaxID=85995 RepID=A0ABR3V7K1_HUMIN
MPDALGPHRCPACFKTYKRREHLQRHRSTHTAERPHRCALCGASFRRSDVLKRHVQTCDGASASSASRRRACDRCVRQKKACNSGQPCLNCERRAVEFSVPTTLAPQNGITDMHAVPGHPGSLHTSGFGHVPFDDFDLLIQQAVSQYPLLGGQQSMGDWFDVGLPHHGIPEAPGIHEFHREPVRNPAASRYRGYTFRFLSDFTCRTGLVSSFECATLEQRQQIVAAFQQSYLEQQASDYFASLTPLSMPSGDFDGHNQSLAGLPAFPGNMALPDHGLTSWSSWLDDPLVLRLQQVVWLVKNVVTVRPNNSAVTLTWSPALEQSCLNFFSPRRFAKFIELYWSVWYPNVTMLHRPTFDPATAKPILLASMALIGACVSPDAVDNEDARTWFNCVEEMVFTDDDFCRDIDPPAVVDVNAPLATMATLRKLQSLQAAYLICLCQNWEGTDASKRRIRRHRFSTLVSTARDLGIDTARHLDYSSMPKHEFNWAEYVVREELIRSLTWIFLLDTAFVIFNNLPHRMVIKEMKMHMATPEACFQAPTADECIELIYQWMPPGSPFCSLLLREAIETVCLDTMTPGKQGQFSQLGPVNLFAIVSAIHYMIFQHQNSLGVEGQLAPIRNGLRNWIEIWEEYASFPYALSPHGVLQEDCPTPSMMWKRIGFVRFSPEYWLLGSLLADRLSAATDPQRDASSASGGGPTSPGGRTKQLSADPILEKYDQTSMRQVNDLITGFQKFNI